MGKDNFKKVPQSCLWYDQCECEKVCEDYTPADDMGDLDEMIENGRMTYRAEYFKYASENGLYD